MDQNAAEHDFHWVGNGPAENFGPQGKRDFFQHEGGKECKKE
jgi:hypothetical protein